MYEWTDLRYFLAVHRHGSLAAAGRSLRVNPTTVGRRVTALESKLRARLFVRSTSGWVATPSGLRAVAAAERAEEAALDVKRLAGGASERPAGLVRLTTLEVMASRVIAPELPTLHAQFPDIRVDLLCSARVLDLSRGEADIAVRVGRPTEPDMVARRISTAVSRPYASVDWLESRQHTSDIDSLHECEVLQFFPTMRWAADLGDSRVVLRSTELSAIRAACVAGLGVALLPDLLAESAPNLVPLDGLGYRHEDPIWMVMHRDLAQVARVRAVADFLVMVCDKRQHG